MSKRGKESPQGDDLELAFTVRIDWLESGESAGVRQAHPQGRFCRLPGCGKPVKDSNGVGRPAEWCERKHSDLFYRRRERLDAALQEMAELSSKAPQLSRDEERAFRRRQRLLAEARACYVQAAELPVLNSDPQLRHLPWVDALLANRQQVARSDDRLCDACNGEGFIDAGLRSDIGVGASRARSRRALIAALHLISRVDKAAVDDAWFTDAADYTSTPMSFFRRKRS